MRLLSGSLLLLCLVGAMAMPQDNELALRAVSQSTNQFSSDFTQAITKTVEGNLISSPLSADIVLAMAAYGSRGQTEQQFRNVLHLPQPDSLGQTGYRSLIDTLNNVQGVTLSLANKIFVNKNFHVKPSYTEVTTNAFHSTSEPVTFDDPPAAAKTINTWVKEQTHDRIDGIVNADDLDGSTAMVLVNAVYFKGLWKDKFDPEHTQLQPFHVDSQTTQNVPTMFKNLRTKFMEFPELDAKMLELQYQGGEMSMIIILPNKIDGLSAVENKLSGVNIGEMMSRAPEQEVNVWLPKWKIETTIDLEDPLKAMGLTEMFGPGANFSGIADAPLYVSKAIQKAFIEVNEEGSEAAAVTGIQITAYSLIFPKEFVVNKPFAYAIVKVDKDVKTGVRTLMPVFTGHVVKPETE